MQNINDLTCETALTLVLSLLIDAAVMVKKFFTCGHAMKFFVRLSFDHWSATSVA